MIRSLTRLEVRNRLRMLLALLAVAAAAAVLAACSSSGASSTSGGSSTSTSSPAAATSGSLKTTTIGGATVLTSAKGFTLYSFAPDTPAKSNCNGTCAQNWPPVKGPATASGVTGTFGTIKRSDGSVQATFDGHPLYTFVGDTAPGQAKGNGLNAAGGLWHEITTSGTAPPAAPHRAPAAEATGTDRTAPGSRGGLTDDRAASMTRMGTIRGAGGPRGGCRTAGARLARSHPARAGFGSADRHRSDPSRPVPDRVPDDPDDRMAVPAAGDRGLRPRVGGAGHPRPARHPGPAGGRGRAGFALATLGGYLLSVWTGLFGFTEVRTGAGIAAGLVEVAAFVVLAALALAPAPANAPAGGTAGTPATFPAQIPPAIARAAGITAAALAAAALLLLGLAVAGANSAAPAATGTGLRTTTIGGTTVLTNAKGFTLYSFDPDTPASSKCYGSCAVYWPPVTGTTAAGQGLPGKVTTIIRTDGSRSARLQRAPAVHLHRRHRTRPGPGQQPQPQRRALARSACLPVREPLPKSPHRAPAGPVLDQRRRTTDGPTPHMQLADRADWALMIAIHDALRRDLDQLLHATASRASARARWARSAVSCVFTSRPSTRPCGRGSRPDWRTTRAARPCSTRWMMSASCSARCRS